MKITAIAITCVIVICLPVLNSYGQEKNRNEISLSLGHAHIGKAVENGQRKWLVAAAWGLDYNFFINKKWGIGLHRNRNWQEILTSVFDHYSMRVFT